MEKFLNELRRVDIFGYQITLRMNQQSTYRTGLGGLMSIIVIGVMIWQFSANFNSFLNKEQLNAVSITEYDPKISDTTITDKQLLFAIAIQQENFIHNPFFNISLIQKYNYRYQNGSQASLSKEIPLVECTQYRFEKYFQEEGSDFSQLYFNSSSLSDYLCPVEEANFQLGGTHISEDFLYLQIIISKCNHQEALNKGYECASQEQLNEFVAQHGSFKFQIYNINSIINPYKSDKNYKQLYLDDSLQYTFIPNQIGRTIDVYLKHYHIVQDNSLMPLSETIITDTFAIEQLETKIVSEFGNQTSDQYVQINFKRSPFKTTIKRNYMKFDEMLSNLGGIQQILFFFVGIVVTLYNKLQMMIELANRVYEFSLDNTEKLRQQQEKLELINLALQQQQRLQKEPGSSVNNSDDEDKPQTIHQTLIHQKENNQEIKKLSGVKRFKAVVQYLTVFKQNNQQTQQKKESFRIIQDQKMLAIQLNCKSGLDYFEKQIKSIISRSKPIYLSFKILVNVITCNRLFSKQPRIRLINKGMQQAAEQIDIYNIVQNMNEMVKLKEVVLSYHQQLMFGFTPKPQITLDDTTTQPTRDVLTLKLNKEKDQDEEIANGGDIFKPKRGSGDQDNYLFYAKIYNSYDDVLRQSEDDIQNKNNNVNKQLIEKLGPELQLIFKLSKLIDFQSQNSTQVQIKTPYRRGAMQQKEQNVYAKMFNPNT
ncbi:unnamed protein product [Paramecium pentaurelia]|uniref:Transmembrane protein n=1 Tax=Paramecium pentaurelia TaxID=43138 RepID=A0A8S1WFL9_9CILI|nr:unnamed protein product [Paramecium pentaurelia]